MKKNKKDEVEEAEEDMLDVFSESVMKAFEFSVPSKRKSATLKSMLSRMPEQKLKNVLKTIPLVQARDEKISTLEAEVAELQKKVLLHAAAVEFLLTKPLNNKFSKSAMREYGRKAKVKAEQEVIETALKHYAAKKFDVGAEAFQELLKVDGDPVLDFLVEEREKAEAKEKEKAEKAKK